MPIYDRYSRSLEMRAARLAIVETLERLDAHGHLKVTDVSDIAKRSCEQAAQGTNSIPGDTPNAGCGRDHSGVRCCEFGRDA